MSIQWFPGHMDKALKEIEEKLNKIDVVIEIVDARLPFSSSNPLLKKIRRDKPCIKVLNKKDLADDIITAKWIDYYSKHFKDTTPIAVNGTLLSDIQKIPGLCKTFLPERNIAKPVRAMVVGIPNVGKSTFINTLAGRKVAKTGNVPAITKHQQRVGLKNKMDISDTPGVLWPNIEDENSSLRLASSGAVSSTVIDIQDVAIFAGDYILKNYAELLVKRFKLKQIPETPVLMLEEIGKRRGCLKKGGIIDYYKAADAFLNELRNGIIGKISFETPDTIESLQI